MGSARTKRCPSGPSFAPRSMTKLVSYLASCVNSFSDQKNPHLDPKIIKIGSEMAEICLFTYEISKMDTFFSAKKHLFSEKLDVRR